MRKIPILIALALAAGCSTTRTLKPFERTGERRFVSPAVEKALAEASAEIDDPLVRKVFLAAFPNTLDTTVREDGYVITGDIDAMWLRDSASQVWPYLPFAKDDPKLAKLIAAVLRRQFACIRLDPYANAFYDDPDREGEWKDDFTEMKKGVHERKYELDSLCHPLRLAYGYWKATGDRSVFDADWIATVKTILATFREQQRKAGRKTGYRFRRNAASATDTLSDCGYGRPARPIGLIASAFRPSDDACTLPFLVPANFFAADVLSKAAEILEEVNGEKLLAKECRSLEAEIREALALHAVVDHPQFGKIYAYEIDGFGGRLLMDDANLPSLLSLPYLCGVAKDDPVYLNTRRFILSEANPYYFKGKTLSGVGSQHTPEGYVWPMALAIQALTSDDEAEVKGLIHTLASTTGGTGLMHEGVNADDPGEFTREWFAWANSLFGELVMKALKIF